MDGLSMTWDEEMQEIKDEAMERLAMLVEATISLEQLGDIIESVMYRVADTYGD